MTIIYALHAIEDWQCRSQKWMTKYYLAFYSALLIPFSILYLWKGNVLSWLTLWSVIRFIVAPPLLDSYYMLAWRCLLRFRFLPSDLEQPLLLPPLKNAAVFLVYSFLFVETMQKLWDAMNAILSFCVFRFLSGADIEVWMGLILTMKWGIERYLLVGVPSWHKMVWDALRADPSMDEQLPAFRALMQQRPIRMPLSLHAQYTDGSLMILHEKCKSPILMRHSPSMDCILHSLFHKELATVIQEYLGNFVFHPKLYYQYRFQAQHLLVEEFHAKSILVDVLPTMIVDVYAYQVLQQESRRWLILVYNEMRRESFHGCPGGCFDPTDLPLVMQNFVERHRRDEAEFQVMYKECLRYQEQKPNSDLVSLIT